jgi:hypothetical protein
MGSSSERQNAPVRPSRAVVPALLLACLATLARAQQSTGAVDPYHTLLQRLQAKDTSIDFTALRLGLTKSADYSPYGSDADTYRDSLRVALERRDFRHAVTEADSALAIDYLDVRTHIYRAYAIEQLGDSTAAAWDRVVATRLVRSISESGAGTVDSPYVVITVSEEYALLSMTGYESDGQALGRCGARPCDVLDVHNHRTGAKRRVYFDISVPEAFLDRMLKPQ